MTPVAPAWAPTYCGSCFELVPAFDKILRQVLIVPILAVLLGAGALIWQMRQAR